ncbi:MAG: DUF1932 domain-containing protein [Streptosporangiales bacterium]|jgi:3-hydroxyisobutyrate dehydrogenase-like beta-hydroxyacid dehydrogenase|nr:DUF1932 domain-containing protein [Streptosporangiales bacterium]
MGAAVGGELIAAGHEALWAPADRSELTTSRADDAGLRGVGLHELMDRSEVILSICPPAAAEDVAGLAEGYEGIYVEANAITPDRVDTIASMLPAAVTVDGAIIGSPPRKGKRTTLYLAGPPEAAARVETLFAGTLVEPRTLGTRTGLASALKLSYTTYQKTSRVLAAVAYALAVGYGIEDELLEVAGRRPGSYLAEVDYVPKTAARAWRWGPEMLEAADALASAGLPDELARAAADVLARWPRPAGEQPVSIDEALRLLSSGE